MAFAAVTAPALLALTQTKMFQQKDQMQQVMFAASIPVQAMYLSQSVKDTVLEKQNGELQNDLKPLEQL